MRAAPELSVLYADIVAAGGLGAALRAAAVTVPVDVSESGGLYSATVASRLAHRGGMDVRVWHRERRFSVTGSEAWQELPLFHGTSADLEQVAVAARAWHQGESMAAIGFLEPTGRIEVPDGDPALLAESEWLGLRVRALNDQWLPFQALVGAAFERPELRRLYPYTSHYTLRFSTTIRPDLTDVPVMVTPSEEGFAVHTELWGGPVTETTSAGAAVEAAVAILVSG